MLYRSEYLFVDEGLSALQGYGCAFLYNSVKNSTVIDPIKAAICFAGIAFSEKLIYKTLSEPFVSGSANSFGPIPLGLKKIVSYGLATLTTLKIMQLAGVILSVPYEVTVIGLFCLAILILSCIKSYVRQYASQFI